MKVYMVLTTIEKYKKRRTEYLQDKFCVECGSTENLEIDHVDPRTKDHTVSWTSKVNRIEAELAKCVVRCKSCHQAKSRKEQFRIAAGTLYHIESKKCQCNSCRQERREQGREQRAKHKNILNY